VSAADASCPSTVPSRRREYEVPESFASLPWNLGSAVRSQVQRDGPRRLGDNRQILSDLPALRLATVIGTETQIDRESALWAYRLGCRATSRVSCPFDDGTPQARYWTMGRDGKPWRWA
jgi:hypothetical protein